MHRVIYNFSPVQVMKIDEGGALLSLLIFLFIQLLIIIIIFILPYFKYASDSFMSERKAGCECPQLHQATCLPLCLSLTAVFIYWQEKVSTVIFN